jgi:transposase
MVPLSEDLRNAIIRAWKLKSLSTAELADLFGVGTATITRLKRTYRATGDVKAKPHGGGAPRKIAAAQEALVEVLVQRHPEWSEDALARALAEEHGIVASPATVGRVIRRLGYSVKKNRLSRPNATALTSSSSASNTASESVTSPLRVWFSWTKPARTSR